MESSSWPAHCEPASAFLTSISRLSRTCVPTPAAFTSVFFGTASIVVWVLVLLPQVVGNYHSKSVKGFTSLFISLWIAGDIMGVAGTFLTGQAAWQILLAIYYLIVDSVLLMQCFYYGSSRESRTAILPPVEDPHDEVEEFLLENMDSGSEDERSVDVRASPLDNKPLPPPPPGTDIRKAVVEAEDAEARAGLHHRRSSSSKSSTIRNALLTATVMQTAHALTVLSSSSDTLTTISPREASSTTLGRIIAWPPMILYIASRFPIILRSHRRRSTAGFSPWFILGTLCGNGTYLAGLAADPRGWADLPPYGGHGWVGSDGSQRTYWLGLVAPYVFGSTVLASLDIFIGVQSWLYRHNKKA